MRRVDWGCALLLLASASQAANTDEPAFRFSAPIGVRQGAAFVALPLPVSAYAHSLQPGLNDLRIVDARGERVPFAQLPLRASQSQTSEQVRDAVLYPLPPRPAAGGTWPSPVEVRIDGDHISVKRRAGDSMASDSARSAGWLLDLGERKPQDLPPQSLRMQWSGPAEFSIAFDYETSDDLRQWRRGGSGQLMALASPSGTLAQPTIVLPAGAGRFVRLVWSDPSVAPALTGAKVIASQQRSVTLDAPTEIRVAPSAEPPSQTASTANAPPALHFDLGGALPLVQLDLQWSSGTRVAPVRLQARNRSDEAWHAVVSAVFYRLERGSTVSTSPPLALHTTARFIRVVPDPRAAALDAAQTQLVVQAQLATLVFATQGQPPYRLLAGSPQGGASALAADTLVPALADERARFGEASLGDWSEVEEVARQEQARQRVAAMRPWLLWAVLLAGVAGLGFMVWRLVRGTAPA